MRIAYFTLDEVNEALARQFADLEGLDLEVLSTRDGLPDHGYAAAIFDIDSLPVDVRADVLHELRNPPRCQSAAVHSYNLDDNEIEALETAGVVVARRLTAKLFRRARARQQLELDRTPLGA